MRPRTLAEYEGQAQVVGPGKLLARLIESDRVPSMVLWGPPGVGKTTLGRIIAERTKAHFVPFSAVLGSVGELREIVREAQERKSYRAERTIVFVDEIHRFNKGQQDAFLPHVEAGTVTLVGATTENPSFAVNAALLSRARVFRLEALPEPAIVALLRRALEDRTYAWNIVITPGVKGTVNVDARPFFSVEEVIGPYWLRALAVELGTVDFAAHAGTKSVVQVKTGQKSYGAANMRAAPMGTVQAR
jgi:putative ATPase